METNAISPAAEFRPFPKIPRLRRDITITEKLDGTNAQINIARRNDDGVLFIESVGSRNRFITPGRTTDNFGFAGWVHENAAELLKLGEGQHFGEWYGHGIGRGYGLPQGDRRFALFNTHRWTAENPPPACCEVVPVLYHGTMLGREGADPTSTTLERLRTLGSVAVPGYMNPEGVIVYHGAAKQYFKVLLENDDTPKGLLH
jgi:hypothetical protein